ncbi:MAG: hypothetical protein HKO79_07660 [Desulfobacterales bacterium]|nr:porin family protein [Deltaproteobacteria bacterium]NNL42358.1 hypothetical protein [Desulfobacterales bacterium]
MKKILLVFIAIALIVAFSIPSAAGDAEWNFYGSARVATFWFDNSKERAVGTGLFERDAAHTPPSDDKDLQWALQSNARIGATVANGDVGGAFEYGTGVNVRKLYGTWNFGAGTLLVGQTYTPFNIFNSNQVIDADADLLAWGAIYEGRKPLIQVSFGNFKLALIQPSTSLGTVGGVAVTPGGFTGLAGAEADTTLPKIEVAYSFKTDMFEAGVVGGYNEFEIETDTKDYDIDSWAAGIWAGVNLGPVFINANVYQALNGGNFGISGEGDDLASFVSNKVKDVDTLGYAGVVGFKANDSLTFEGGYGKVSHDSDVAGEKDDDTTTYYVQAVITLAPGVMIIPEYGKIDYEKNNANAKEGDTVYYGAKWQINF